MKRLTPYQEKVAKLVGLGVEPDTAVRAAFEGKYMTADMVERTRKEVLKKRSAREEISRMLDLYGLDRPFLVKKLFKLINRPYIDPETLRKSLKDAFELHGDLDKDRDRVEDNGDFLEMFVRFRKERNLPIPDEVQDEIKGIREAEVVEPAEVELPEIEMTDNRGRPVKLGGKKKKEERGKHGKVKRGAHKRTS